MSRSKNYEEEQLIYFCRIAGKDLKLSNSQKLAEVKVLQNRKTITSDKKFL